MDTVDCSADRLDESVLTDASSMPSGDSVSGTESPLFRASSYMLATAGNRDRVLSSTPLPVTQPGNSAALRSRSVGGNEHEHVLSQSRAHRHTALPACVQSDTPEKHGYKNKELEGG